MMRTYWWSFLCCLPAAIPAQTTWVVDASRGPGSQFAQIQPAVDAAATGDRILVRAGRYAGFRVDAKGLRISGVGRSAVVIEGAAEFTRIGAGTTATLHSMSLDPTAGVLGALIRCVQCDGHVHLEDLDLRGSFVDVQNARLFTAQAMRVQGGLRASASGVQLNSCNFDGVVAALRSELSLTATWARGTDGSPRTPQTPAQPPLPALSSIASSVTLAGPTVLTSGTPAPGTGLTAPAVQLDGGDLELHPTVLLVPGPGATPISGTGTVSQFAGSSAVAGAVVPGSASSVLVSGPTGSAYTLLVGLPAPPTPSPFSSLWLDPSTATVLAAGTFGSGGPALVSWPVPGTAPSGVAVTLQPVSISPSGVLDLGEPTTPVIR